MIQMHYLFWVKINRNTYRCSIFCWRRYCLIEVTNIYQTVLSRGINPVGITILVTCMLSLRRF